MNLPALMEELQALAPAERMVAINALIAALKTVHPNPDPVSFPQWIPSDQVVANEYNPNTVAPPEMRLLYRSIKEDGYTQPIVAFWDAETARYVIVDGFHRHRVGKEYKDIRTRTQGYLPIVVIDKPIQDRMAATIRHNRARGQHSVEGMTQIVAELIQLGWMDAEIGQHLGMDPEEVWRLKQQTGLAEVFRHRAYSRAWTIAPEETPDDE